MKVKAKGAMQDMDKEKLRSDLRKRLLKITPAERAEKSWRACENLIETGEFQNACTVMMYMPLPHELDISEAILKAWQMGKIVAVPKISWEQRHMIPVEITSLETGFSTEVLGLRNPVNGRPVPFEDIDLVVTPALGYDRKGHRLGRGGSYYDNFLANEQLKAVRCGMGFDEQVVDEVPVGEHDEPIDFLVTDKEVIHFNIRQGG
jgi:5-formyltetrahydrofolate cyclo-ligase